MLLDVRWFSSSALFGLGLLLRFARTRICQSMLSGTRPLDPVVVSGVIATLLADAVLASLPHGALLGKFQCSAPNVTNEGPPWS
jgi:hypothetical protein